MSRYPESVRRAREIAPRSMSSLSSGVEGMRSSAIGARRMATATRASQLKALETVERVRRSSIQDTFKADSEIWDRVTRFGPPVDSFERERQIERMFARIDAVEAALEASDDHTAKRMAFLLEHVGFGYSLTLKELIIAEGPRPFIEVLAPIVLEERARRGFRGAVQRSSLSARPRQLLNHGLDHLDAGEYDDAFLPLVTGVEGALRCLARRRGVQRSMDSAPAVAQALGLRKEHKLLVSTIYREVNDGRHGDDSDARADCVWGLLGFLIWVEQDFDKPVLMNWLVGRLNEALHAGALAA